MEIRKNKRIAHGVILVALCFSFFACGKKNQTGQGGVKEYAVITLQPVTTELNQAYPATIRGRQDIEIRPQVSGFITKLCVDEGSVVRKGQTLFVIDPVQYEAAVKVAEAAVKVSESNVATARLTAANKRELFRKNIISEYELQMADNDLATQQALLAQSNAQLGNARKNLSYIAVTSPTDGVVGTIPFRVGSLVSPTSATPLTTVSDISEMYVYFSMNEKQVMEMIRQADGPVSGALDKMPGVSLKLADGSVYSEKGKIETLSGVIDPKTGAASIRATFPNPKRLLRSGNTGSVLIPANYENILVVPQKATYEIQDKKFAYVVNDSMAVINTEIQISPLDNGANYIVTGGLKAGDRVVVEGVSLLKDGMTIKPITPEEAAAKIEAVKQKVAGK